MAARLSLLVSFPSLKQKHRKEENTWKKCSTDNLQVSSGGSFGSHCLVQSRFQAPSKPQILSHVRQPTILGFPQRSKWPQPSSPPIYLSDLVCKTVLLLPFKTHESLTWQKTRPIQDSGWGAITVTFLNFASSLYIEMKWIKSGFCPAPLITFWNEAPGTALQNLMGLLAWKMLSSIHWANLLWKPSEQSSSTRFSQDLLQISCGLFAQNSSVFISLRDARVLQLSAERS